MAKTTKNKVVPASDDSGSADIAPATDFEASGAVIEPGAKKRVDMKHPAVDDNPREGTTKDMNRIDFNDPTITDEEAVIENLKAQK